MRGRRLAAVGLSTILFLTACGGDDETTPGGDRQAADRAIAAFEEALRGEGFDRSADEDDDEEDMQFRSAECQEFEAAFPQGGEDLPGETASVDSDKFERGELGPEGGVEESVEGSIGFVSRAAELESFFALFEDDRLPACLIEAFRQGLEDAATEDGTEFGLGDVDIDVLDSDHGDQSKAFSIGSTISVGPVSIPFSIEIEIVRVGRGAAFVILSAVGPDEPSADRAQLIEVLIDELERHT